jgi:uncharacterized membrane protein YccC
LHRPPLAYLLDRLLASDPSLDRLRSSLRALLTAGIAAGLFLLLTTWLGLDYPLALPGIVVPMMSVVAVQDPGRRAQYVTMAWVPVLATVALVAGTFVADNAWLSGGLFLLTIFAAFEARRFGPRGNGLGAIAYQSFFYALLFKTPPDKVQWLPLFVFSGCAIAWIVHFRLVPEHAGALLRHEMRAFRARTGALLHDVARWLDEPSTRNERRIDIHLAALNDQSLALDARLAGFAQQPEQAGALRDAILRCEIALETIASVVRAVDAGLRPALAVQVRALHAAIVTGRPLATPEAPLPATPRWRLAHALQLLATLQPWRMPLPALRDERQPAPPQPGRITAAKGKPWPDAITRRALQACASALGAMLIGHAISPSHWYWAVFSGFIVFTRAATVGQTLSGAWRQVLAALAGLCLGVAAVELVHGSRHLELTLLFVFVALGFYAFRGLQNIYTMLLMAMLGMVYELMGMNGPGLLLLRLAETAAGALCAVLAARFVLPVHTDDASDDKSAALLRTAGGLLGTALGEAQPPLHAAVRPLDRSLQALRQALGPVTGAAYPASKAIRRRHLDRLSRIAWCVRHCYVLAAFDGGGTARPEPWHVAGAVVRRRLEGVAIMLEAPGRPAQPGADLPGLAPVTADGLPASEAGARAAAALLCETDDLLRALQVVLARPDQ